MSGHSKWNNIKRKKEATDAAKGKIFTKIGREIMVCVKESGPDPNSNSKLRDLIAKAKANNVPNDNIDRVIKKAAGGDDKNSYESMVYEGYGPNGVAVIVECLTDNKNRTAGDVRHYFDKFGGNLGTSGCVSFMFSQKGVVILAATNRPDILDPALLRPGRFDRQIYVGLPDIKGREEILKVHAKKVKIAPGVDFNTVARMASGASGAELANIVNEAALRAVRAGRKSVTQADLEESIEVVIAGYQKKNSILTDQEKCIVAYHEIGHALVAAKQSHSAPVQKITIIPRTSGALGYTMQVDEGNHYLMNQTELENKIATFTGGRAAEELVFHSVTTGASNDIEQATKLARAMITRYGMSQDFDMVALETVNNQYLGGDTSLACSAQTQREIDQKVVELVKAQHAKALQILTENRDKLDQLAKFLYEKETITGEEFMAILNGEEKTE